VLRVPHGHLHLCPCLTLPAEYFKRTIRTAHLAYITGVNLSPFKLQCGRNQQQNRCPRVHLHLSGDERRRACGLCDAYRPTCHISSRRFFYPKTQLLIFYMVYFQYLIVSELHTFLMNKTTGDIKQGQCSMQRPRVWP